MATQLNQAQSQNSDKLPSRAVQNPRNVSAITLRSGEQTEVPIPVAEPTPEREKEIDAQKRQPPDHAGPSSRLFNLLVQPFQGLKHHLTFVIFQFFSEGSSLSCIIENPPTSVFRL